ncbi:hypothetical protein ACT1U9_01790 [Streptomyces sp. BR1]|uniref:hypothetical protein n=1 Tax=Streptomyces sp. BR1 TaxID=1592323 RepID=UPI00402BB0DD
MHEATTRRAGRAVVTITAVTALSLTGCSSSRHQPAPGPPSHRIAFQVGGSGTADVGYSTGAKAAAGVARHASLPWKKTVRSTGTAYTLTVVLGSAGGDAACSISLDGRELTGSTAHGPYGRATCSTRTSSADD